LKVGHVISYYEPAYDFGGDVRTVAQTCKALAALALDVTVLTTDAAPQGRLDVPLYRPQRRNGVAVTYYPVTWRGWPLGRFFYSRGLSRACVRRAPEFDLVHFSSTLWADTAAVGSRACLGAAVPYVVSPHGILEPWHYAFRGWKKRLHMRLCGRRVLERADAVHAVCSAEAHRLERLGLEGKVACIPPGIDMSEFARLPPRAEAEEQWPVLRGRPVILFLSRLHQKKGLDQLVAAFAELRRHYDDAVLVLAGPDDGYRQALVELIDIHGIRRDVVLTGMLKGRERLLAFAAADVFVLPSYAEGLPRVLIEAMACRLPLLITPGCNFPEVPQVDAGLIAQPRASDLADGLRHLFALRGAEREAMGARGRALVQSSYTWDVIARKMVTVYRRTLDARPIPLHPEPHDGRPEGGALP
jgi:glycosyltransferase involved in cell wall biosynthesis